MLRNEEKLNLKTSNAPIFSVISGLRYYAAELGRWASRDPIGEEGFQLSVSSFDVTNESAGRPYREPLRAALLATVFRSIVGGDFSLLSGPSCADQAESRDRLRERLKSVGTSVQSVLEEVNSALGILQFGRAYSILTGGDFAMQTG